MDQKPRSDIGTADEEALKQQCWEQTVFIPPWDILLNTHWGHERNMAHDTFADPHFLRWQGGKGLLCFG